MTDCGICVKVWLQEFAWTEEDKEEDMKSRSASTGKLSAKDASSLQKQPMFCMETAVNMFYWSVLVYDHEEVIHPHRLMITSHALIADIFHLHDNSALQITANCITSCNDLHLRARPGECASYSDEHCIAAVP